MVKESSNASEEERRKDDEVEEVTLTKKKKKTGLMGMETSLQVAMKQEDAGKNNEAKQPCENNPEEAELKGEKDQGENERRKNTSKICREDDGPNSKVERRSKLKSISDGQHLPSGIEFLSSSDEGIAKKNLKKGRKSKIKKSQAIYNSESSEVNEVFRIKSEGSMERGTRGKLVEEKKSTKRNTFLEMETIDQDQTFLPKQSPLKHSIIQIEPETKQPRSRSKISSERRPGLLRSEKISSSDREMIDESSNSELQKPIDVVVHVHYENEGQRSKTPRSSKQNTEIKTSFHKETKDSRCFQVTDSGNHFAQRTTMEAADLSKGTNHNSRHGRPSRNKNQKVLDNFAIEDSLDLIEEFKEATRKKKSAANFKSKRSSVDERSETIGKKSYGTSAKEFNHEVVQSPRERIPQRKRWCTSGSISRDEVATIPHRKRWMEETNIEEPLIGEILEQSSSTSSSRRKESSRPVPAPRSKVSSTTNKGSSYDNPAYESDHEDVLRIETLDDDTNCQKSTKIELTKIRSKKKDQRTSGAVDPEEDPSVGRNEAKIRRINLYSDSQSSGTNEELIPEMIERVFSSTPKGKLDPNRSLEDSGGSESSEESEIEKIKSYSSRKTFVPKSVPRRRSRKNRQSGSKSDSSDGSNVSENHDDSKSKDSKSISSLSQKAFGIEKSRRSSKEIDSKQSEEFSFDNGSEETVLSESEDSDDYKNKSNKRNPKGSKRFEEEAKNSRRSLNRNSISYEEVPSTKRRKKKKRKNSKSKIASSSATQDLIEEDVEKTKKYISVIIHKSDILEMDFVTKHPMVKVHIVDINTGNYVKLKENDYNYGRSKYLQPMITGKFDYKENKSIVPNWEEELIFEYDFGAIERSDDKQILLLFEIVDLLSFAEASFNYKHFGNEGCWHKIAWAFLRPKGANGVMHTNKRIRLQLHKPLKSSKKSARNKCEVFNWWRTNVRDKYPSSLYVTVAPVEPPSLEPIFYEELNLEEASEVQNDSQMGSLKTSDSIQLPKWTRLSAQTCKIPNEELFQTEVSENGCFFLTFSNNGKYLACVQSEEYNYPIVVYAIPEGTVHVQFSGHKNFVYALNWSHNDEYLLSVSSDQTACLWDIDNKIVQSIQMLPHPSYVYCGKFYPGNVSVIATGCYDHVARIWGKSKSSNDYELIQELETHRGFVNSLCFQKDGDLITADSNGIIAIWTMKRNRRALLKKEWHILKRIKVRDIEKVAINTIVLHPLGSRLLVHSRDNGLRMLDLGTGVVLQQYKGLKNQRIQTTSCISPCGGLVLCGGKDSTLNVWGLESGVLLANYSTNSSKTISCVDYHPFDHILSYSSFGSATSVKVLRFDKNSTGENVGLKSMLEEECDARDNNDITMTFQDDHFSSRCSRRSERAAKSLKIIGSEPRFSGRRDSMGAKLRTRRLSSEDTSTRSCDDRRETLKLKLKKLNESDRSLKTKSTNRLNNIIEKIDKILSNTGSKCDLELTQSPGIVYAKAIDQVLNNREGDRRLDKENLSVFAENGDGRTIESGSKMNPEDLDEISVNTIRRSVERKKWQSSGSSKEEASSGNLAHGISRSTDSSTPGTSGTYVVRKNDGQESLGAIGSDSSTKSNVTFTIENEIPIPKPRRK